MGEYNINIPRLEKMIHERPGAAIHCDSENKAIKLLSALSSLGYTWFSGHELGELTYWGQYKEKTCYVAREDQHKVCFAKISPIFEYECEVEFEELLGDDEYIFDQEAINEFALKPNIAIHCDTEEKATALLKELERHGFIWASGAAPTKYTNWDINNNETCYINYNATRNIRYDNIKSYSCPRNIVEFDDIASKAYSVGLSAERFISFLGG